MEKEEIKAITFPAQRKDSSNMRSLEEIENDYQDLVHKYAELVEAHSELLSRYTALNLLELSRKAACIQCNSQPLGRSVNHQKTT